MIQINNELKIIIKNENNEAMNGIIELSKEDIISLILCMNTNILKQDKKDLDEHWKELSSKYYIDTGKKVKKLFDLYNLVNYDLLDQQENE